MKKVVSIGLIFLMSVQCFYKLGIITYYQLNLEYISEVLCINKEKPMAMCYGQCFLKRNLQLADETQNMPAPVAKEKLDIPAFLISQSVYAFKVSAELTATNSRYLRIFPTGYYSSPFRPPSAA